jgi:translation initiation factor 1
LNKKIKPDSRGFVYSTDPDFQFEHEKTNEDTLPAAAQLLRVKLDTKHRAGKIVTLVTGFKGRPEDLEELGRKSKSHCGSGGSVKDGEIIIQGDHRDKVWQWLLKNGYKQTRKS